MTIKFCIQSGMPLEGVLTYCESEYGFAFSARSREGLLERLGSEGVTSALIDTLQLEIDIESREVLYAWGYYPNVRGRVAKLGVPSFVPGRVSISSDHSFQPGVSFDIPGKVWQTTYDPSSGWVAIRLRDAVNAAFVQIADGVVLGIENGDLVSVWLDPIFSG